MERLVAKLPSGEALHRRRGAFAGFATGVFVPLVIAALVLVSFRGHGIMDAEPTPPQVYTAF